MGPTDYLLLTSIISLGTTSGSSALRRETDEAELLRYPTHLRLLESSPTLLTQQVAVHK